MSHEFNDQRQCQTCFVCLSTNRQLRAHIEGYRSQERQLLAELEKCRAHLTTLDDEYYDVKDYNDDDDDDENYSSNEESSENRRVEMRDPDKSIAFQCPYEECERVGAFKTRKNLLRHFTIHVQCREICAFCEKIFTYARPYIAHKCKARDPNNEPKDIYTRGRYEELRRRASKELHRMLANDESLSKSLRDQVKKRARVADESLEVSRTPKRAKTTFDDVNEATNEDVLVVEPPGEIYAFLQPPRNIGETIATNGDFNSHFSAPLFYHPVGGLTNGDFDSNFSAPLFYETMGGSNGASDEIFHAPIFEGLTPASNSTALQFHAEFITQQQASLKNHGGWT